MEKPTVFLSHSSRDSQKLTLLREMLERKTAGTLNLFLSSDGQSIPFGRNWVASIEHALDSTAIMFSFLTPNSLSSSWVSFEAGYAYARGVRVIPVACMGLTMDKVHPPLALLQGFNLTSFEGLNNILSIVNDRFTTKYELSFAAADYETLFAGADNLHGSSLGRYTRTIDLVEIVYSGAPELCEKALASIIEHVPNAAKTERGIYSYGINASIYDAGKNYAVKIELSPDLLHHYAPIICRALKEVKVAPDTFNLRYNPNVYVDGGQSWRLTSRFFGTDIKLVSGELQFHDRPFQIRVDRTGKGSNRITLVLPYSLLEDIKHTSNLNDLLWATKALNESEYGF